MAIQLIPKYLRAKKDCLHLAAVVLLVAFLCPLGGSLHSHAQSVPIRVDTKFFGKQSPTPPELNAPEVLDSQTTVLPSGARVKKYVPVSGQMGAQPPSFARGRRSYRPPSGQIGTTPGSLIPEQGSYRPPSGQIGTTPGLLIPEQGSYRPPSGQTGRTQSTTDRRRGQYSSPVQNRAYSPATSRTRPVRPSATTGQGLCAPGRPR